MSDRPPMCFDSTAESVTNKKVETELISSMAVPSSESSQLRAAMEVRALDRAVGWLRPFVETMGWDYVVVWKIADDPSRFIEWVGCCCSGSVCGNVKEEEKEGSPGPLGQLCRDGYCEHFVRTRACEELSQFPSVIPLYSGIHGEVAIANEYRWMSSPIPSNPNASPESMGTRVLIPVAGGIIELFNTRTVPEDRNVVELLTSQCLLFSNQESMMMNLTGLFLENYSRNSSFQVYTPSLTHEPRLLAPPGTVSSYEGSSNSSNPPNEDMPICRTSFSMISDKENNSKTSCRSGEGKGGAKNLLAERRRRTKLKERLFALRAVVPKISKMNSAAILDDAVDYIVELKGEIESLRNELEKMEEEERQRRNRKPKNAKFNVHNRFNQKSPVTEDQGDYSSMGLPQKKQVEVDVKLLGNRAVLVRLLCEKRQGWLSRLMEVLCYFGLIVLDANVTTLNDVALTVLHLQAQKDFHPKKLKDSLTKFATHDSLQPIPEDGGCSK